MTGPNNPLSEHCRNPRREARDSPAGARSANPSRLDLLATPASNNTSTSSTGGLFSSYLGGEASLVATTRARGGAQGTPHGAGGEAHPRGASGRLESHRATPRDPQASTCKTAPPPDAPHQQQVTTAVVGRRSAEAAELLLAPALGAASAVPAAAGPQRLRNDDGFTRLPVDLLAGRRSYSHAAGTARYDWSEGSVSARPSSTARTGGITDPEASSASRIISGMRAASVSSVYPLPSVHSAQRSVQPPSSSTDAVAPSRREVPGHALERPRTSQPAAGALRAPSQAGKRADSGAMAAAVDTWRAPAVAYNAVERRIGRDATALRAVSARLDAAATAIDAVEVGVRSASDSLDSLLHLLESRPVAAALAASGAGSVAVRSTSLSTPGDNRGTAVADTDGVGTQVGGVRPTTGVRPTNVVSTGSSNSVTRSAVSAARGAAAVAGGMSGGVFARALPPPSAAQSAVQGAVRSGVLPDADTKPTLAPHGRGSGSGTGGESRAPPRVVQREIAVSTPPGDRLDGGEDAGACAGHATIALAQRGASVRAEIPSRATVVLKAEEDPRSRRNGCERFVSLSPPPEPSVALEGDGEVEGGSVVEQGHRGRDSLGGAASAGYPWRAGPAHAEAVPRAGDDGAAEAATSGAAPLLSLGDGTPSVEDRLRSSGEEIGSGRAAPGEGETGDTVVQADLAATSTGMNATREGSRNPRRGEASLPVLELEAAMDGIDAERGRLILEIARLRGQQNESLIHLQRLQHEQFVVRQRQVSTLSDIVNSFGRTVEAAGALPHGEDSSLGRISGDVVSTLRRMLRLLSATVPAAGSASRAASGSARAVLPLLPSLASSPATLPVLARSSSEPVARASSRTSSAAASGTYAIGGWVALRPAGDLTQEVIDAAFQALPRLAAAATAISGARRIQGFLAGEGGGEDGGSGAEGRDTSRRCSVETIAALPDAPPSWRGGGGGDGDGGGGDGGDIRGCVICLSEDSTAGQLLCHLPCDHVFHRVCVGKWLRVQDSCPTCRRQVPDVNVACEPPAPEVA